MRSIFRLMICQLIWVSAYTQTYNPFYGGIVGQVFYDSVTAKLHSFENLGVKEFGTVALTNTKNWIASKYSAYGYTDITYDDFTYFGQNVSNIIVTKTGTHYPNTYVIIDAHYDTKNGTGTNDNGTGTAILLELARLIKDIPTQYSIKFVHFTAEEIGLVGSENYVNEVVIPENLDIKILFNIDEVGGVSGMTNDIIVCERDESDTPSGNNAQSWIMTDELAACVELYSNLTAELSYAYSSDYVPFEDNGEVITGLFEKNYSPYSHTSNDVFTNLDPIYVHEVAKASMGALLHYAVAYDVSGLHENIVDGFILYPSLVQSYVFLEGNTKQIESIRIFNQLGIPISAPYKEESGKIVIDFSEKPAASYFLQIRTTDGNIVQKRFQRI